MTRARPAARASRPRRRTSSLNSNSNSNTYLPRRGNFTLRLSRIYCRMRRKEGKERGWTDGRTDIRRRREGGRERGIENVAEVVGRRDTEGEPPVTVRLRPTAGSRPRPPVFIAPCGINALPLYICSYVHMKFQTENAPAAVSGQDAGSLNLPSDSSALFLLTCVTRAVSCYASKKEARLPLIKHYTALFSP